jgi:hypothetical protein
MATMTLKGVPATLVVRLKREARGNRRSLNQEALARLEASLDSSPARSAAEAVSELRRLHRGMRGLRLTDAVLAGARRTGRP